jgi:hypothetical protein
MSGSVGFWILLHFIRKIQVSLSCRLDLHTYHSGAVKKYPKNTYMKNFSIIVLCTGLFLSSMISAQTIVPAGPVSGIWTKTNSPYRIQGDINVPSGQTLTIQSGVLVEFKGYYMLNVKGNVRAMGAPGDTIIFTVNDTAGFHNIEIGTGGWNGIKIDNLNGTMWDSDTSVFEYCKFQYGKSIETAGESGGGAMFVQLFLKVLIRNCLFWNNHSRTNGGAIYIGRDIRSVIYNSAFINNKAAEGGAIFLQYNSYPVIRRCLFYLNKSSNRGGAILSIFGKGMILNNTFSNNTALGYGGAISLESSREAIIGNLIVNNYSEYSGGGIKMTSSWPKLINNHICNNHGGWGGGIESWGLCNADYFNNILWGNTDDGDGINSSNQVRISSATSTPNFYNCIIQNGINGIPGYNGQSANIIEDYPQFINPTLNAGTDADGLNADWTLSDTSPAVNHGSNVIVNDLFVETDLSGNPRIIHGIIDIGAFEKKINSITAAGTLAENTSWIADKVLVTGDIIIDDGVILDIAPGTNVEFQDTFKLQVKGTLTAKGSKYAPVIFTVNDTTGFSDINSLTGCWKGIIFDNSEFVVEANAANGAMNDNDSSILRYCIIQFAKQTKSDFYLPPGAAIQIRYFSKLEISNCTIQKNIAVMGGAIGIDLYSHPLVSGNIIYRNIARDGGGGIYVSSDSKPRIINNFILNNSVITLGPYGWSGGGGIQANYASPDILNNVICNNFAHIGGAIFLGNSNAFFSANTICNNLSTDNECLFISDSRPEFYNSIIWGNKTRKIDMDSIQIWSQYGLNFYYNNIQGGQEKMFFSHDGAYEGNINSDPVFTNPTEGPGIEYDALQADWSITDLSPSINKGFPDVESLRLSDKDIAGNKRVNHDIIDIGAFENQGDPVQIILQPFGPIACAGDNVEISVQVEGTASFQWLKNDKPIAGAASNTLVLNSVTPKDVADYLCIIRNGYGMLLSHAVKLIVNSPPEILFQTESQWIREDDNIRLEIHARGTEPLTFGWLKNGLDIQEVKMPEFRINNMSLSDEGTYICQVSNECEVIESAPITLIVAPQICMVTVDLETGKNLVIWEKKGLAQVIEYNIYRESIVAGQYERIGQLTYDALSVFVDTVADPSEQAYIYKITATDAEGIESNIDLCKPHKTIHLITSTNMTTGDVQLSWDPYYGFEYGTYYIYRSQTQSNFDSIHSMSSSTAAYTDIEASTEKLLYYYRVAVKRPSACYPESSGNKAGTGPYSQSMSNIEDNRLKVGLNNLKSAGQLTIFPNPFNEMTILKFPNPENKMFRLKVMDLTGKILRDINGISGSDYVLERDYLEKGYYIIELSGDKIYRGKIVVE